MFACKANEFAATMKRRNQTRLLIIILTLWVTSSCSILRPAAEHAAVFQSHPNSLAVIRLDLKENYRFDYDMTIYPELGEPDSVTPENFQFKGRWTTEDENYILRFRRRSKPDLYALFSQGTHLEVNVKVLSERRVSFHLDVEEIIVWGIRCYREEK